MTLLDDDAIKAIDEVRAKGAGPHQVAAKLHELGVPDPHAALAEYQQTTLPDGTPRGQINPADPDYWHHQ